MRTQQAGLYHPEFEHDSCGFGLIAQMDNQASHWLVQTAVTALGRMTHRGAVAADGKTGDGCGLLLKKPDAFLRAVADEAGIALDEDYAAGMVFMDRKDQSRQQTVRDVLAAELQAQGLAVAGWRVVPTDPEKACGKQALANYPHVEQVFVNAPSGMDDNEFNVKLFVARRKAEKSLEAKDPVFYIPSLSSRVVSYKGLVMPANLPVFYTELTDERLASSLAVFHQRFSTNTLPQWRLAQPFRYLAHNGEINTIRGNRNWSTARAGKFHSDKLPELTEILPLVSMQGSDSSSLDNMLELLLAGGMDIFRAMRLLIPPAWQNVEQLDPDLRAFYEYNSQHMEPWDGPAGIVLTDGRYAACVLDRNGLRPARYVITEDRHITLASEIGVYDYQPQDVVAKGRLKPGQMIAADTQTGKLLLPEDIDTDLAARHPYKKWLHDNASGIKSQLHGGAASEAMPSEQLKIYEKLFQVSFEERDQVVRVLAEAGQEAIGSMGDDTPFPVLSSKHRSLYDYFRQVFAQVTNPPIDPLREQIVMSLETCFGAEANVFVECEAHAKRLTVDSPVMSEGKFRELLAIDDPDYAHKIIDLAYPADGDLRDAITKIAQQAVEAVRSGKVVIVLSDRHIKQGMLPVHALLATGAVHHALVKENLRCDANIVVETATSRDSHHFACLLGYGATAIYPYLAYECLNDMVRSGEVVDIEATELHRNFRKGINKGLYKIMSKMGISTIASYRGAQLFEIVGLHDEVVDLCFTGTTSRIQGTAFADLHADQAELAKLAWNPRKPIEQGGLL
ncbi:MAG: glutamate synthase large subunit, partial [Salinisphaeraceae bacterium]|nr:glutamate synthase large subunit [Salinisphaeraceae bacterium]